MIDIEKKAREYANNLDTTFGPRIPALTEAFLAGAAYALGNQWRDAEKEKPPCEEDVLTDYPYEHGHSVGYYDGEDWYMTENDRFIYPTHWMPIPPIPDYKPKEE